ncbi:MAG: lytic murein transglycosylase [Alphaproteobacteria bacterium]|nr:lytic murein transglycosylase [Alphaproteobacteria bacterium]
MLRKLLLGTLMAGGLGMYAAEASEPFSAWLDGVRSEALERGIRAETLEVALANLEPVARVIELDRNQPEFKLTFRQYLDRVVSDRRARKGRELLERHAPLLGKVSETYGVPPRLIVALWGIETDFGRITGGFPVIAALATLAHDGRRSTFFRRELMLALEIIDQGHIAADDMIGSWAGAMGQNQFMPSSFHAYAVDHDGDGEKNIWGSLPDIFASTANYLSRAGWSDDTTWGRPVRLPTGFPGEHIGRAVVKGLADWQRLGVRKADGTDLPGRNLPASVITPQSGSLDPAFVVYENFEVILKWNRSEYFAIAVGTLADRLGG